MRPISGSFSGLIFFIFCTFDYVLLCKGTRAVYSMVGVRKCKYIYIVYVEERWSLAV